MIEQVIGHLSEINDRGCRHGKLIHQLHSELENLRASVNEQAKEIRHLQQRLAVAEDAEPTFAVPFASWQDWVIQNRHKDTELFGEDCCPVSAEGAVYRVKCHMCEEKTFVCAQVQNDTDKRTTCLRLQGWSLSESTRKWRCRDCTRRYYYPQRVPEWALTCCESHASTLGWSQASSPPLNTVSSLTV